MSVYPVASAALVHDPPVVAAVRTSPLSVAALGPQDVASYVMPTVGTVSTPDSAVFTIGGDVRFSAKVTFDDDATGMLQTIASNRSNGTPVAAHFRVVNGGLYLFLANAAGTSIITNTLGSLVTGLPGLVKGETIYVRADVRLAAGLVVVTGYASRNGVTWTTLVSPRNASATYPLYNSAEPMRIGRYGLSDSNRYQGKIFWVQVESLNGAGVPTGVIWRFDASDYIGVSPYTDSRGFVWTVTNNGIARAVPRPVAATAELRGGLTAA